MLFNPDPLPQDQQVPLPPPAPQQVQNNVVQEEEDHRTRNILIGGLAILAVAIFVVLGLNYLKGNFNSTPAAASVLSTSTPTTAPAQAQQPTASLPPPASPAAAATSAPAVTNPFAGLAQCPYTGTGSPQPEKIDVATFKLQDGRNVYAVDLSRLPGCAVVFEGRLPWQTAFPSLTDLLSQSGISDNGSAWDPWKVHFIIDVRSVLGTFDPTIYNGVVAGIPDQYKSWFVYSEGSFWFYDPTWNMSDLKTAKPSIAQELEVKKFRDAMKPGEYNYPRIIVQPGGRMFAFWQTDSGDAVYANGTAAGCTKTSQPELIPVYGLWDGSQFSAAIGAGNCKMAYWADGSKTSVVWKGYQKDGKEIVSYQSFVVAYMFPAAWSESQVNTWIDAHPGGK